MASINDLPAEIILSIANHSATSEPAPWLDVAAFAHTNRKHYSALIGFLYQISARCHFPVFWAAQNGRVDVLYKLMEAGLETVRDQEWLVQDADFPSILRVLSWAGHFESVNILSGVLEDGRQGERVSARFARQPPPLV